ncbi:DNA starvation/stationary phase protection protein [Candidatus Bealeia paramacronuclearis]|uniref:DNA starvation/stationary phase protection protein n=1 Tax=Candidatus Bealeia paramacronuclearis TaxID=1921001 RepID=A0ABZ2C394_9PROT|nr:DNA starvation/stationary phase protection protein [Candidatus Bealeia paramacronuclearis]
MSYLSDEAAKKAIITALNKFMADSAVAYIKIHGFHWNVVGPHFKQLHALFEEHYTNLWKSLDTIAERIRALGGKAPGSFGDLLNHANIIREIDTLPHAEIMLRIAHEDYTLLSLEAHKVEKIAEEHGDTFTVDMMTQRVGDLEKMIWMTLAHLQGSERL